MQKSIFSGFFIVFILLVSLLSSCAKVDEAHEALTYLKIEFHVQHESRNELMAIMSELNKNMSSEAGFVKAYVYIDDDDVNHITLIETWQTRALHEQHYQTIVSNGSWASILSMLSDTPDMAYMSYFNER